MYEEIFERLESGEISMEEWNEFCADMFDYMRENSNKIW